MSGLVRSVSVEGYPPVQRLAVIIHSDCGSFPTRCKVAGQSPLSSDSQMSGVECKNN